MNCVAKRVPDAGASAGFFAQPSFELQHKVHAAAASQAYLFNSIPLLGANDQTNPGEELRRQLDEPLAHHHHHQQQQQQQQHKQPVWKLPSDRQEGSESGSDVHDEPRLLAKQEEKCDEERGLHSEAVRRLDSFKCSASRPDSISKTGICLSSCDNSRTLSWAQLDERRQTEGPDQPERRHSLESIESRASSSSSNRPASSSSRPNSNSETTFSGRPLPASGRSVLVGTRFVSPPKIEHTDQAISVSNWQTIELEEEVAAQTDAGSRRQAGRLGSLITSCKLRTSRDNCDGSKQLANVGAQANSAKAGEKESMENMGGKSSGWPSGGSEQLEANGGFEQRKLSSARSKRQRERVDSGASFKSVGSFKRSKPQIGKRQAPFMFAGILGSILGSVFFSIGMLCIKLLPDGHGVAEKTKLVFCRGCIMMFLCGATILWQKSTFKIRRDEIWVNVLRSVFGFTGVYGAYISLKYISMGDSTALVFSSPIWTSLLSHFILNEPLQWIQLLALPASLVGIIFIAHPALLVNMDQVAGATERQPLLDVADVLEVADLWPLSNSTSSMVAHLNQTLNRDLDISMSTSEHFDFDHRWKGIVVALGTSFIVSFVYIVLKFRKTTPIQTTTFWLGACTVLGSLTVMCFTGFGELPQSGRDWSLLLCNGLCSWLGQVLLQWALAYEDASVLSVIRTLDVAMTFTLSALFLDEQIMWTSVLGAAIIAVVVLSIMLNTWISKKLCPASVELEAQLAPSSANSNDNSSQIIASNNQQQEGEKMTAKEGEITLKLEAPSVRKLRHGELAA